MMKKLKNGYECQCDWPENCFVQGDNDGLVLGAAEGARRTAFFEAFPKAPNDTFIRGEGTTLEEAEQAAFAELEKYQDCSGHEFDRKNDMGSGVCQHCDIEVSYALPCVYTCSVCSADDAGIRVEGDDMLCAKCYYTVDLMGYYYASKAGEITPSENESPARFWEFRAYDSLAARTYVTLQRHNALSGLTTREISDKVNALKRYSVRTHTMAQDVAIRYLLKMYKNDEAKVCFYTQELASQLLADPGFNDDVTQYHYAILDSVDRLGFAYKDAVNLHDVQLNDLITRYVQTVLTEAYRFNSLKDKPTDLVRARTSEEAREGLKSAFASIFSALAENGEKE